jgi:hypothetical protein
MTAEISRERSTKDLFDSFGSKCLQVFQLVDGKTLSCAYSNKEMPESFKKFQNEYYVNLSYYINKHDNKSKLFLEKCINNLQFIINEDLSFLDS